MGELHLDDHSYKLWMDLYADAERNMADAASKNTGRVLIEVAAQHPLIDGKEPGIEFSKRLDRAAVIFKDHYGVAGSSVNIYVPGSLHVYNGVADKLSLSEEGKRYLMRAGVPEHSIVSPEVNSKYTNGCGVYCSEDECTVAARIFRQHQYGELICVCSSGQLMRKVLLYLRLGLLPEFDTVSCAKQHHNYVWELFNSVSEILSGTDTERVTSLRQTRRSTVENTEM